MADFIKSFASLFSAPGIIGFLLGVLCEYTFLKLRCKYLDKTRPEEGKHKVKIKRVYWVWALVFIVIGGLTYKTQTTYDLTSKIANDNKQCQKEFFDTLQTRSKIGEDNDHWSYVQRTALADWLNEILNPPADIVALDRRGSGYDEWAENTTRYYFNIIHKAQEEQNENIKERADHPYPEPTCGH